MKKVIVLLFLVLLGCTSKTKLRETEKEKEELQATFTKKVEENQKLENALKISEEEKNLLKAELEQNKKTADSSAKNSTGLFLQAQEATLRMSNGTEINLKNGSILTKSQAEKMWKTREENIVMNITEEYQRKFEKDTQAVNEIWRNKTENLILDYERQLKKKNDDKKVNPAYCLPLWVLILIVVLFVVYTVYRNWPGIKGFVLRIFRKKSTK